MEASKEAKWYVAHTYSGYENKVKVDLEKTIQNRNLGDRIFEVSIPTEEVIEVKNGVKKVQAKKLYPGYVLVRMIMDNETWYIVRNTRGVTGFLGPAGEPIALKDDEMISMGVGDKKNIVVDFNVGDEVMAVSGAWRETVGKIRSINESKQTVTIMVDMFGRETPVELGFTEVRKK